MHLEAAIEAALRDEQEPHLDALREELTSSRTCGQDEDALWRRLLRERGAEADYAERVHVLLQHGRTEEAASIIEEASVSHHGDHLAVARVAFLVRQNRYSEAVDVLTMPSHALGDAFHRLRAALLFFFGRFSDVIEAAEQRLGSQPFDLEAIEMKAVALLALQRPLEAMQFLDGIPAERDPMHRLASSRADALKRQGRISEALAALSLRSDSVQQDALVEQRRIEFLASSGKEDEALSVLERATRAGVLARWDGLRLRWLILDRLGRSTEVHGEALEARTVEWSKVPALEWLVDHALFGNDWSSARTFANDLAECRSASAQPFVLRAAAHLLVVRGVFVDAAWSQAAQQLMTELGDGGDCWLPLSAFMACARFGSTGDRRALLGLPLEVRALVEPAFSRARE